MPGLDSSEGSTPIMVRFGETPGEGDSAEASVETKGSADAPSWAIVVASAETAGGAATGAATSNRKPHCPQNRAVASTTFAHCGQAFEDVADIGSLISLPTPEVQFACAVAEARAVRTGDMRAARHRRVSAPQWQLICGRVCKLSKNYVSDVMGYQKLC